MHWFWPGCRSQLCFRARRTQVRPGHKVAWQVTILPTQPNPFNQEWNFRVQRQMGNAASLPVASAHKPQPDAHAVMLAVHFGYEAMEEFMDRRLVLKSLGFAGLSAAAASGLMRGASSALAQSSMHFDGGTGAFEWGNPVLDMHFHCRETPEACLQHLDGAGITMANLLTNASAEPQFGGPGKQLEVAGLTIGRYLGRFFLFTSADDTRPDVVEILKRTAAAGTRGFGELSVFNMAIDGPEMGRIYDLAAEMQVPVLMHYQDYSPDASHAFQPPVGFTRPQFARLVNALKNHPKTIFIGHGPAFWGNLGPEGYSLNYPSGPIKPGGLTQSFLDEYPNLYGGLDAASGINALYRDPEFSKAFLVKHQNKLMFGSDCGCTDGHGGGGRYGAPPPSGTKGLSPFITLVAGKCLARVQLAQLKQLASPEVFRKITWENGLTLVRLSELA